MHNCKRERKEEKKITWDYMNQVVGHHCLSPKVQIQGTKRLKRTSYLKMEISWSQEWLGKAMKKQTAANSHTAETIAMAILETFWLPRCTKPSRKVKLNTPFSNKITKIFISHLRWKKIELREKE
jgi:hypothetical protein